jgi:hypothetical protein
MKRRPKRKKRMKTKMLLTLGAVLLTAITFNANANDTALSPRAAANQIKTVPVTTAVQAAPATGIAQSPRAAANQIQTVSGANNDPNVATACRNVMTGSSPKAVAACEANSTMPGCNTVAVAPVK